MQSIHILQRELAETGSRDDPGSSTRLSAIVSESAWLVQTVSRAFYRSRTGLRDLELRILLELGARGGSGRRADIAQQVDIDRSQVGRGVKRLQALDLVRCHGRRVPISLTPQGQTLVDHLAELASACERQLLPDFDPNELASARRSLMKLFRAAGGTGFDPEPAASPSPGGAMLALLRLTARVMRRAAQSRSAAAADLTAFEAEVLMRIARGTFTLTDLGRELNRDKGQLSRLVSQLVDRDLVVRPGSARARTLLTTERGRAACRHIEEEAGRCDGIWSAALSPRAGRALALTLTKLSRNAVTFHNHRGPQPNRPSLH